MLAYTFQQEALLRLLTALFAAAGIVPGGEPVARLPRLIRNEIARVLLPLESALRRIIYYRMLRLPEVAEDAPTRDTSKRKQKRRVASGEKTKRMRAAVFQLFDKSKWFAELADPRRRPRTGRGPQISVLDGRASRREPVAPKPIRDPDDASKLCRRLQAAMRALLDIDAQAYRLRRIIAARKAHPKPKRTCPMRPGFAPGWRETRTHEVDEVLYDCVYLANERVLPDG